MKHLLITAVLTAPIAALISSPLSAQDRPTPTYSDQQLIETIDMPLVAVIAEANGYRVVEGGKSDPGIIVENIHGEQAILDGHVCEVDESQQNCTGLAIARHFADGAALDPANIALVGRAFLSLKLYLDENSVLVAERFMTLDGGVTMKHVASNIDLVFEAWQVMRPYVTGEKSLDE